MPNLDDSAHNIFTDGSSQGSPRTGGCGFVLVWADSNDDTQTEEVPGGTFAGVSNNEMELLACVAALRDIQGRTQRKDLRQFSKVVVYTDSQYVAEFIGHAQAVWPKSGWKNRAGRPLDNVQLWNEASRL